MAKSIKKLKALSFKQAVAYAQTRKGEEFHPKYFEDQEAFIDMMVSQIRMEKDLKKYFKTYYEAVLNEFNWSMYESGFDVTKLVDDMPFLTGADILLAEVIAGNMEAAWGYGVEQAKKEIKQDDDKLNKFTTSKYYDLARAHAKQINKTTRKVLIDTLKKEREIKEINERLEVVEQDDGLLTRLRRKIISEPRVESITDTETISFFAGAGAIVNNFFSRFQKIQKNWNSVLDARTCQVCRDADSKGWVGKDHLYPTQFGLVKTNPAHARCRCYVEYRTK